MMAKTASFPRAERIIHAQEFRKVLRKGAVASKQGFALYYLRNDVSFNRLGIIIGSKIIRRAVDRNRIKRVTRNCFRTEKSKFKKAFDLVFRVQNSCNFKEIKDLREIIDYLLAQTGIYH